MNQLSIILVDDERRVRNQLRRTLEECGGVSIIGEASTVESARQLLVEYPDVQGIFLDIQLSGGTGFDLVPDIPDIRTVVFVTAYDQYAIRAFEVNALDYVMKPASQERLQQSLVRLRAYASQRRSEKSGGGHDEEMDHETQAHNVHAATPILQLQDQILLKFGVKDRFVRVEDIYAVRSADNYTEVYLSDGTTSLMRKTLEEWEESLPEDCFVRIHRSTLVNLQAVEELLHDDGGRIAVRLQAWAEPLPVSRGYAPRLRELFR